MSTCSLYHGGVLQSYYQSIACSMPDWLCWLAAFAIGGNIWCRFVVIVICQDLVGLSPPPTGVVWETIHRAQILSLIAINHNTHVLWISIP